MPIPFLIWAAVSAITTGLAASKGTQIAREVMNEGERVSCQCYNCKDKGPHTFLRIDNSWSAGSFVGLAAGGIGGTIKGATAPRIFRCSKCGSEIYEDGEKPSWNADNGVDFFLNYGDCETAFRQLQTIVASNQVFAKEYSKRIQELEVELKDVNTDKAKLKLKIEKLIDKISIRTY